MKNATKPQIELIVSYIERQFKFNPNYTINLDMLKISNKEGNSVAHWLANRNYIFTQKEILLISDFRGDSIAHIYARKGLMYKSTELDSALNDFNILSLISQDARLVAMEMAYNKYIFNNIDVLALNDHFQSSVADVMAGLGHNFSSSTLLELQARSTVQNKYATAHIEASKGRVFTDSNILRIETTNGYTVAHEMAEQGCLFTNKDYYTLTDADNVSVAELSFEYYLNNKNKYNENFKFPVEIFDFIESSRSSKIMDDYRVEKEIFEDYEIVLKKSLKPFKIEEEKEIKMFQHVDKFNI